MIRTIIFHIIIMFIFFFTVTFPLKMIYAFRGLKSTENFAHFGLDCAECHEIFNFKESDNFETINIKLKSDIMILCNKCHLKIEAMHKVNISPSSFQMKVSEELPLNDNGKITCITCHKVCKNKKQYLLRSENLCPKCHDLSNGTLNPHFEMKDKRKCMYCHYRISYYDCSNPESSYKRNIKRLCVKCHLEKPHPESFDHIVVPTMNVNKGFPLDYIEITCITCHDPHMELTTKSKILKSNGIKKAVRILKVKSNIKNSKNLLRRGFTCNICHKDMKKLN